MGKPPIPDPNDADPMHDPYPAAVFLKILWGSIIGFIFALAFLVWWLAEHALQN